MQKLTRNRFKSIKGRCNNPNKDDYKHYGGRGIKCEWNTFNDFKKDMEKSFIKALQTINKPELDRIDNNKNYCKSNCRWVDRKTNLRNMRSNVILTFKNKTMTLIEWSEKLKIDYKVLKSRINYGWSIEQVLGTPVLKTWNRNIKRSDML